ncbi:efflux RND transporter periplasmic adaptor subunit [Exilibacterium tricleocarpae]|uniref:Efflux RND transporter periplasmic adaptor subunit n=1 Tax=Exilibacterium tricleocarpae TaxID=2591008 RepID=A0A545TAC6_9GAMM|nr:efflux RND transporter periplasmic adaptor subunit [Exilibacterium tricleocarpae]TQV74173.1 efflux RND transporter periplasmic adaptor subunit [Exilibacterium tricleocarpae]
MLRLLSTIVILGAAAALAGCSGSNQDDAAAPLRPVTAMRIAEHPDTGVRRFPGTLRARDRSELSFDVAGTVTKLHVDIGDSFNKGDILAQLDDQLIRLDLSRSEADLIEARATLAEAELDHTRRARLVDTGAIARAEFDAAAAQLNRTRARVESLLARVDSARRRLRDTRVVAPYNGEVAARHIEPAQTIQVGLPVLSVVGSGSGMEAAFYLPERLRPSFAIGTPVSIHIKSTGEKLPGTITQISTSVNGAGLYPVTAAVEAAARTFLSPGMAVDIAAKRDGSREVIIPHTAILAAGSQTANAVYRIDPVTEKLLLTPVRVERLSRSGAVISTGLDMGDIIVTRGVDFLDHGQAVYPTGLKTGVVRFNP